MKDRDKTKEQLINELAEMRKRITELDTLEIAYKRIAENLRDSEDRKVKGRGNCHSYKERR